MSKSARYFVPARYTELSTYLCLEIITLFVNPSTAVSFGVLKAYKKSQGFVLKIGDFFWFGLGLWYIMTCDITLVGVQVRMVILINDPAQGSV